MNRINNISQKMKKNTYEKKVPKTDETTLQQKIDTLLPNDLHNLEDPSIYLTKRRKESRIDEAKVRELVYHPLLAEYKEKMLKKMEEDPDYTPKNNHEMTLEEHRYYTNKNFGKLVKYLDYKPEDFKKNKAYGFYTNAIAGVINASISTKFAVHFGLYTETLLRLGSDKHVKWADASFMAKNLGCFGLTELGHGSNVQGIITTATYKHEERAFILNTPHDLGMKYWIGNAAKTANYGVIFAKMIVGDKDRGVHVFHVELRDLRGNLKPGVVIGDIGHKLGMNGVDNGWMMFKRVKLPYDALLDKYSQIDSNGVFKSVVSKKTERFALQLAALSGGRLLVSYTSSLGGIALSTIGLRYLSTRKQFGAKKYQEETLINYPLVQSKLFPFLATSFVGAKVTEIIYHKWLNEDVSDLKNKRIKELHAVSSFLKAYNSWKGIEGYSVIRELCGGHGYSADSKIGSMIQDMNIQVTWEGANDVLIQQTAKFVMTAFGKYVKDETIEFEVFSFIKELEDEDTMTKRVEAIKDYFLSLDPQKPDIKQLFAYLKTIMQIRLKTVADLTVEKFSTLMMDDKDMFKAYNKCLPNAIYDASIFYGEYMTCLYYMDFISAIENKENYRHEIELFEKLLFVFVANSVKSKTHYLTGKMSVQFFFVLDELLLTVYDSMISDLVVLTDSVILSEKLLNSTLGVKDGDVYRTILSKLYSGTSNFGKSKDWKNTLKFRGLIK